MQIRNEEPADLDAIARLTCAAFEAVPYSDGSEPAIIDRLRKNGDLFLSRVMEKEGEIVGHIAFSPVRVEGGAGQWFGLGPVSVAPAQQRLGIGSQLVRDGLGILKLQGATGCVLVGDPEYYRRFGFTNNGDLSYEDLPSEFVQWLSFDGTVPKGGIIYSSAFSG
ncbi:MAG: N-acetyltransferase [Sneathiella sp.]|uniref:GNAT family N-acetyltransferase n=1 Tax=Sneathiella sp. TaxID=1964365 RepID=UPI003001DAA9